MRTLRLALAGLLAALGLVVITDAPSHACSCVVGNTARYLAWSDVAFTGTLVEVDPPPETGIISSGDPVTYAFDVDRVFEGEVPDPVEVVSARDSATCGISGLAVGHEYVVYASDSRDGGLQTTLCSGTTTVARGDLDRLAELTGTRTPPAEDAVAVVVAAILALFGLDP